MKSGKKTALRALMKFLLLLALSVGAQSAAYALCAPVASPSVINEGSRVTFFANCDNTTIATYQWTVFGQTYDSGNLDNLSLVVPQGIRGLQTVSVLNSGQTTSYSTTFTVNPPSSALPITPLGPNTGLNFPLTAVGQQSQITVEAVNLTGTPINFAGPSFRGANAADFSATNNCPGTILPGASCSVDISFKPLAVGSRAAQMDLVDNLNSADTSFTLSGVATDPKISAVSGPLTASPNALVFPATQVSAQSKLSVQISNRVNANIPLTTIQLTGADFSYDENDGATKDSCTGDVATNGNCVINVTFSPTKVGSATGLLRIFYSEDSIDIPLSAIAVAGAALTNDQIKSIAAQQITANLQSMQIGLQTQLSNVNKRIRYLRFQDSSPTFRQEIDISVNGKGMPLPDSSGGGGGCVSSGKRDAATTSREQCEEDYKGTRNGRWGAYISGGVGVNENTLSGAKINSNGITIGTDYRLSGKSAMGAAFGAMKSSTNMAGEAGKQDATGYSFVGYGSYAPTQASFIDFAFTAGSGKFDLKRLESAGTTAVADTSGTGVGVSLTAGLDWRDRAWAITPYLRAEYIHSKVKGFTESGKDPIQVGNQSMTSSLMTVGAETQYTASTSWGIFIPHARIELQQQSQSAPDATAQAVGSSVQLTVSPDLNKDKSFGNAALGASAQFGKGKTGFLDFEKTFGKENFKDQRITTGFKIEF